MLFRLNFILNQNKNVIKLKFMLSIANGFKERPTLLILSIIQFTCLDRKGNFKIKSERFEEKEF